MAKIIQLFGESREKSKPWDVRRALKTCLFMPAAFLFVFSLPFAAIGLGSIYLASRLIYRITGEYPVNVSFRLGEFADCDSSDS